MPARRSRTERWRESLVELRDRAGPIEISVTTETGKSLVWRVRLLDIDNGQLIVERPTALRRRIPIQRGSGLVGGISIGQNRWMFLTGVLAEETAIVRGRTVDVLRLSPPESVERCQRRSFFRISTATLDLPAVGCWSLIEPTGAMPLEIATQAAIVEAASAGGAVSPDLGPVIQPALGPGTEGVLLNLGGGGACLRVPPEHASVLDRSGSFLLKIDLMPTIPLPLPVTARVAHCRVDSSQHVHAGFSFDFSMNRSYETLSASRSAGTSPGCKPEDRPRAWLPEIPIKNRSYDAHRAVCSGSSYALPAQRFRRGGRGRLPYGVRTSALFPVVSPNADHRSGVVSRRVASR